MRPTRPCPSCGTLLDGSRLEGFCPKCAWDTIATEETPAPKPSADGRRTLLSLPGHDVLEEIARGGMGIVYRARQHEPSRAVALKMLLPHQLGSTTMRERFRLEARAIAALEHSAILPMYNFGEQDGMPFFTMKLAAGGSLANRRETFRRKWREIAALMSDIAEAVHFAHERGILHRDLKPGNILFDEHDHAYVSDFGLAKIIGNSEMPTRSGHVLGTPQFLAPEIARGNAAAATTSTDQYSLGAMLYELLTGQPPFNQEDLVALLRDICERQPKPPREIDSRVPPDLEVICLKCLSKEPERRYPTAAAFAQDLRRWLAGEPIVARPVGNFERLCLWCRRHQLVAALAGLVIVLLAALAIGSTVSAVRLGRANADKEEQLWMARRAQARTARLSRELGSRESGIISLTRASRLHTDPELRNELIAHLPLFDVIPGNHLPTPPASRLGAALSPNLRECAIATAAEIRILDIVTHSNLHVWPRDQGLNPSDIQYSPDGSLLMVETGTGVTIDLFDVRTGREIYRIRNELFGAFSPDNRTIATRDSLERRQVIFHDVVAGRELRRITNGPTVNQPMAFDSGPMSRLFTVSTAATVQFWDWRSGRLLGDLKHHSPVSKVRVRNGLFALGGEEGEIELWDFWSGTHHHIDAHRDEVADLVFSPDNRWLISCARDGECRVWDAFTGELAGASDRLDVRRLDTSGLQAIVSVSKKFQLASIEPGKGRTILDVRRLGPSAIRDAEFSPDGSVLAVTRYDGVTLFDVASGAELAWAPIPSTVAAYFIDDSTLIAIDRRRIHRLERTGAGTERGESLAETASVPLSDASSVATTAVSESRKFLAIVHGSSAGVTPVRWPPTNTSITLPATATEAAIDSSAQWIATVSARSSITTIRDLRSEGAETHAINLAGPSCFSPDGKYLLVSAPEMHSVVRTTNWQVETNIPASMATGARSVGAWSRDGRHLAVAKGRAPVEIWDAQRWERLFTIESPTPHNVTDLSFSPDGSRLAVATDIGRVEVWTLSDLTRFLANEGLILNASMQFAEPRKVEAQRTAMGLLDREFHLPADDSQPARDPQRFPPRDPRATPDQIDLIGHMNVPVAGPWPMRGSSGNTLRELPKGLNRFADTDFDVRGIILLNSRELMPLAPGFPRAVEGIRIGRDCRRIHFLQASTHAYQSLPRRLVVAYLAVHYADGTTETVSLRLNEETADWWRNTGKESPPPTRARLAWVGMNSASELTGRSIQLFKYTWENPQPGKVVTSIDLVSALDTPALFVAGITVE